MPGLINIYPSYKINASHGQTWKNAIPIYTRDEETVLDKKEKEQSRLQKNYRHIYLPDFLSCDIRYTSRSLVREFVFVNCKYRCYIFGIPNSKI